MCCHSGAMRSIELWGAPCDPENLEIPGSRYRTPRNDVGKDLRFGR